MHLHVIRVHFKERIPEDIVRGLLMMLVRYLFLLLFIKAYIVGTHLNCLDEEVDTNTESVTWRLRNYFDVPL